jgi:hypothetical protein
VRGEKQEARREKQEARGEKQGKVESGGWRERYYVYFYDMERVPS